MSLPSPNLDDRKFQDIVDDVKRQIGRRCPEWTDHNVSDPGITLIELFAWITDMMLYRMNQVPEKNYIKFLEMLGVSLESPMPAQTELRFRLSRPIEDAPGEEAFERTLRARETVAATIRTENEEAVEFATDTDLRLVRPHLAHVLAVPATEDGIANESENLFGEREFVPGKGAFAIFNPLPRNGDTLYLGFENDVSGNLVELEVRCVQSAAVGLDEDYPSQRWEVWNGVENHWQTLEVPRDTTRGFNRPPGQLVEGEPSGLIELALPNGLLARHIGGRLGYWVRCTYTTDLPPRGLEQRRPFPYQKPPEFTAIQARVIGGTAPASNCRTFTYKELGESDGLPGQVFTVGHAPILPRRPGETILIGKQGAPYNEYEEWTEVEDFSESAPDDRIPGDLPRRHFVCDSFKGEILFGPLVPQPDGSMRQHGAIPEPGLTITFAAYRYGGGTQGNVSAGQVSVLKTSIPYIAEVGNPRRADGGREQEVLDRAKMRGRRILRLRERAVTSEDYEHLALKASSGVGRARCVQPRRIHDAQQGVPPGVVRVLLIPALRGGVEVPRPNDLKVPQRVKQDVWDYLDERRLLTTVLEVGEPEYLYISTEITLVADPKADTDQVVRGVRERLNAYIHPITGGPNGDGWPFNRALSLSDIYAAVQMASGVAFLLDAKIFVSTLANAEEGLLSPEELVSNLEGVRVGENQLLCTREHRIRPRAIWDVGAPITE